MSMISCQKRIDLPVIYTGGDSLPEWCYDTAYEYEMLFMEGKLPAPSATKFKKIMRCYLKMNERLDRDLYE